MMIKFLEKTHHEFGALEAPMQLEKHIMVTESDVAHVSGHFVDYLDSAMPYVTLCAEKECSLLLWDSHLLLEYCIENPSLELNFKWPYSKELESWCVRNRLIMYKSKEEAHITYHFTLLDSHRVIGELLLSPVFYFESHPVFTLHGHERVLSPLLKVDPIVLALKKNQIIYFDKYHYQMAYNPDVNFIRVNNAHRSH